MNLSEITVMCMHFDVAPLGRFALDVLIALDVESVYYITYNIWIYKQIFIKAINVFALLGLDIVLSEYLGMIIVDPNDIYIYIYMWRCRFTSF